MSERKTGKEVVEIITASARRCAELEQISNEELSKALLEKVWGEMDIMSESADIVDEAYTRLKSQQPTTTPPSEPGYYWAKESRVWAVVFVCQGEGEYWEGEGLVFWKMGKCRSFTAVRQWQGPIPEPEGQKIVFPEIVEGEE